MLVDYVGDNFQSQHETGLQVALEIHRKISPTSDRLILDFSGADWVPAPVIVPIACVVNEYQHLGIDIEIVSPSDSQAAAYLDAVRFPQGVSGGTIPDTTYLPVFRLNPSAETEDLNEAASKIRDLIKRAMGNHPRKVDGVFLPISEAIDNVDLHSEFSEAAVMAQFYPNREFIDICISDDGISIPGSYDKHGIEYSDNEEALQMAVEKGVSTRQNTQDNEFSGTGLRTIRRIVCDGLDGKFMISSNECALSYSKKEKKVLYSVSWIGTTVAARLYPPDENFSLYNYLG